MKKLIMLLFGAAIMLSAGDTALGQSTRAEKKAAKAAEIKNLILSKKYTFKANFAYPLTGTSIPLTSNYDVKLSNDSLNIYLPYYGRAFVAPMDPTKGGIMLETTRFTYKAEQNKKGGWDISIDILDNYPAGASDVRQLRLNISPDGYANLRVICLNRQPISFNGSITIPDKK